MTHTHGSAPPHEHEGSAPGHTHDTAPEVDHAHGPDVTPAPAAVGDHPTAGGLASRLVLSVLGAAGMIIGYAACWFVVDQGELGNVAVARGWRGICRVRAAASTPSSRS